jgi:hypothetical protein
MFELLAGITFRGSTLIAGSSAFIYSGLISPPSFPGGATAPFCFRLRMKKIAKIDKATSATKGTPTPSPIFPPVERPLAVTAGVEDPDGAADEVLEVDDEV